MCHWESAFPPLGLHNVNLVSPVRLWECRIVIVILGIIMAGGLEQMAPISAPLKLDKKESGNHGLKASFLGGNTAFLWKNDNRGKTCEPQCVRGHKRKSKNCLTNQKSYFMQKCSAGCIYKHLYNKNYFSEQFEYFLMAQKHSLEMAPLEARRDYLVRRGTILFN